jgi:hypothetical protein
MPLNSRYAASDLQLVLQRKLNPIRPFARAGGATAHEGYENEHALVIFPVHDTSEDDAIRAGSMLETIETGLDRVASDIKQAVNDNKKIILPVTELQKILGLSRRNHWVTLTYDPIQNTATLIDSRPWYISFLYPTKPMENQLRNGLSRILGAEKIAAMTFHKIHQGVQHNDTHCGAWTAANIMGLAGVDDEPHSVKQQGNAFTRDDEVGIVNRNMDIAQDPSPRCVKPTGWFQRLLIKLGFRKSSLDDAEVGIELVNLGPCSYRQINKAAPGLPTTVDLKAKSGPVQETLDPTITPVDKPDHDADADEADSFSFPSL